MKKSLIALALGTLGLGMSEFGMMSILSIVAANFQISVPNAGHLISIYAVGVCVGALMLAIFFENKPLKALLIGLMVIMSLGNFLAVIAPNYLFMLFARFISGLPHGGFFGVAGIVAKRLADKGKEVQAVTIMISGMTIANLIGIPLASYLAHQISWHMLFLMITVWGVITILAILFWVPKISPLKPQNLRTQLSFLKKPAPWLLLATIMLGNGGIFSWYSYINPIMVDTAGFAPSEMAEIMLISGLGMVLGNFCAGKLSNFVSPVNLIILMIGLMFTASFLIIFFATLKYAALILMFTGVFGLFGVSAPEQFLIIETSEGGGEILGASGAQVAFNLGNAMGSFFGGLPILYGLNYQYSAASGLILLFLSMITIYFFKKYYKKVS